MRELAGIRHKDGIILSWQNWCNNHACVGDNHDACFFKRLPASVFFQLNQCMTARAGIKRHRELAFRYGALQTVEFGYRKMRTANGNCIDMIDLSDS